MAELVLKSVKSLPDHKARTVALIFVFLAISQFTLPDYRYRANASRGVPVCISVFTGTGFAYPGRDGQAE